MGFAMLYVGGTFFTIYLIRKDIITNLNDTFQNSFYLMNNKGNPGDGAGQGGRAEGSIREAGGSMGKRGEAQEEMYFKQLQAQQLKKQQEAQKEKEKSEKK